MAAVAGSDALALTAVLLAAVGAARAVLQVAISMLLQRRVDPQRLARIFGLVEGLAMAGLAAGAVLVPVLMHFGGVALALFGTAAVLPLIALAGGRGTWRLDDGTTRPAVEIRVLRALPHFGPLPSQQLERLAVAAAHVQTPAGTEVVRQGEMGQDFYVLAQGEADVLIDGRRVNHLSAGTAFGEIAVLRSTPRSATVVTTTPAELYRIHGRTLLPVLSGHSASWQSAEGVAAAHLADDRTRTAES
jgi:MFS family permease